MHLIARGLQENAKRRGRRMYVVVRKQTWDMTRLVKAQVLGLDACVFEKALVLLFGYGIFYAGHTSQWLR